MIASANRLKTCVLAVFFAAGSVCAASVPETQVQNEHRLTRDILEKVLIAELAVQRDNPKRAYKEYMLSAQKSGYPELAKKAWETAQSLEDEQAVRKAELLWKSLDPNNTHERWMVLEESLKKGDLQAALPFAQEILSESDAPDEMIERISQAGAAVNQKSGFYEYLNTVAEPYAQTSSVQLVLAQAAAAAKMRDKARDHGLKAVELSPENPHVLIQGADYEFAIDPKRTSERLASYLKNHPNSHQVRMAYAKTLVRLRNSKELSAQLKLLEKSLRDNPQMILILGMLAEEGGLPETAEKHYKTYLKHAAQNKDAKLRPDEAYVRMAMVKLQQGYRELAVQWLHKVESGDQYRAAHLKEAELLYGLDRVDDACTVLQTMRTDNDAQKGDNWRKCGLLLLEKGRRDQAADVLVKAADLLPKEAELTYQVALLCEQAGKPHAAERLLKRFIDLQPDNHNGYNSLGYLWVVHGIHMDQARRYLEKAMQLTDNNDPYVLDSYGWLLYREGKTAEAENYLQKAQDKNPSDTETALHLAEVQIELKKFKSALGILRSVLEGEPKNEKALELMNRLPKNR